MELQQNLERFAAADIAVFAISTDPVELQRTFADRHGITYPLLSDPDHKVIEATGILNTLIGPDEPLYGLPFPGSYVLASDGTITDKLFFANYRTRSAASTVLEDGFGLGLQIGTDPRADAVGEGVALRVALAADSLVFGERANLYVDLDVDEGLHLYSPPVPDGYTATEVTVEAPERVRVEPPRYPPSTAMSVEGLDEEFGVFASNPVRIVVPIGNGVVDAPSFPLTVTVRWQACTGRECFLPQQRTVTLDVAVRDLTPGAQ